MKIKLKILLLLVLIPLLLFLRPPALGGDIQFLIVSGQSMLPNIQPGSLVITKKAPLYQIDEIVSYTQREGLAGKVIVHRIIEETDKGFIIKGDNNPSKDPGYISIDNIDGKVIFATPYVGDIIGVFRNPVVLFVTTIITAIIQLEQRKRKKKREKLEQEKLGIKPGLLVNQHSKEKSKKPDYSLFVSALILNILTYIVLQFSIASQIRPKGDMVTGFLFRILEPSFASTVSFALYFLFLFGLYFLAKVYEMKALAENSISNKKSRSGIRLLLGKETNPMLALASFLWFLFILLSIFHLLSITKDLATVL